MFRNQRRPVRQVESASDRYESLAQELKTTEGSWFDGTVESIRTRRNLIRTTIRSVKATVDESELHNHLGALEDIEVLVALDKKLAQVESEYIEHEHQEAVQALPQYSVMATTRRQPVLGESYRTASLDKLPPEWHKFCSVEPKLFVMQNRSYSRDSQVMRERAVDFITVKSSVVDDMHRRAAIIGTFVQAVERERRSFNHR